MKAQADVQILGGGPAGLGAAYYAKKLDLNFAVIEAGGELGGNCRTIRIGDFLFDTGAHRFHDKDPQVTNDIRDLLGEDLFEVDAPSEIFSGDRFFKFPLRPGNLARQLSPKTLARIAAENLRIKKPIEQKPNGGVLLTRSIDDPSNHVIDIRPWSKLNEFLAKHHHH